MCLHASELLLTAVAATGGDAVVVAAQQFYWGVMSHLIREA